MSLINKRDFPLLPSQDATRQRATKRVKRANTAESRIPGSHATLIDLPDELILEILGYLNIEPIRVRLATLLSLALTSRRLYSVVIDMIYDRYDTCSSETYTFLRAMTSNPKLGEFIKAVDIVFGLEAHSDDRRYVPTARDKKIIKEGLRALGTSDWKKWATRCNEDVDGEALQNAILLHVPNITALFIRDKERRDSQHPAWFNLISRAAEGILSTQTHRFEHLRSITVESETSHLSELAPIFRLQSLRTLRLILVRNFEDKDHKTYKARRKDEQEDALRLQRLIPPACNNIEGLALERSHYYWPMLEVLISSSRRLKSFKYDIFYQEELQLQGYPLLENDGFKTFADVLRGQKASLESLHVFSHPNIDDDIGYHIGFGASLADFETLKHLTCELEMIMDRSTDPFAERLPPSLLTFRTPVRYDADHVEAALRELALNYRKHVPKLEEFRVVALQSRILRGQRDLVKLLSVETGVSFVLQKKNHDAEFADLDGNPYATSSDDESATDSNVESMTDSDDLSSDDD